MKLYFLSIQAHILCLCLCLL